MLNSRSHGNSVSPIVRMNINWNLTAFTILVLIIHVIKAFVHGNVGTTRFTSVNLPRPPDFRVLFMQRFTPMSQPSGDTWNRKQDREEVSRESHGYT